MAYCGSCGGEVAPDQKFCPKCGQPQVPAGAPPAAAPAPPAGYAAGGAYPPQQGYAPAPGYGPGYAQPQPRRSLKWLWIALAALLVAAAIALILVFVVFKGGDSAGASPEQTVKSYLSAMENKDLDKVLELVDPAIKESLLEGEDLESAKDMLAEEVFSFDSLKFTGIKMKTEETSDTTATVTLTAGTASMTAEGTTESYNIEDETEPVTIDLVKKDGKWYVESGGFF
jgi:uncharacterized membrane protein YvbJ